MLNEEKGKSYLFRSLCSLHHVLPLYSLVPCPFFRLTTVTPERSEKGAAEGTKCVGTREPAAGRDIFLRLVSHLPFTPFPFLVREMEAFRRPNQEVKRKGGKGQCVNEGMERLSISYPMPFSSFIHHFVLSLVGRDLLSTRDISLTHAPPRSLRKESDRDVWRRLTAVYPLSPFPSLSLSIFFLHSSIRSSCRKNREKRREKT